PAAPPASEKTTPPHPLMIRFGCPKCKSVLQSPANKAGASVNCPACKQIVKVPKPANRLKARWLMPVSLLILALLGGVLLALKIRSSTDGGSESPAMIVAASAQET